MGRDAEARGPASSPSARSPSPTAPQGIDGGGRPGPVFAQSGGGPGAGVFAQLKQQAERWAGSEKRRLLIAAWTRGSRERIGNAAARTRHARRPVDDWSDRPASSPTTSPSSLSASNAASSPTDLAIVSEQDLLGERISRPPRRRKRADQFIAEATEIAEGDLVVHQDYGIGRYDGLVTLHVTGAPHDCLRLLYDGGDKLFVPVENIEVLSRFGTETAGVALGQARRRRLADPQGADEEPHPRHGRRTHPHRRRPQAARRRHPRPRRRRLGRILRPLPLRRNRRPVPRHRRRAGRPRLRPPDGPPDLRRCRLRQDRGGAARRLRRRHVRRPGRRGRAHHAAGPPAFPRLHRPLRRPAHQGRPALPHGHREGRRRGPQGRRRRQHRHRHRHPRAAVEDRQSSPRSAC